MNSIFFAQIEFMSPEYDLSVRLRNDLLRKPLNLEFTESQLEEESNEYHFGAFDSEHHLIGCLSFKPIDSTTLKMRQVAVSKDLQGKGIGFYLVKESEVWAKSNLYKFIQLHARDTAFSFYKKLNYKPEGEIFTEVGIPHQLMKKNL